MLIFIRALIAAVIIFGIWKLVFYLMTTYQDETNCANCEGKGWYLTVREREKCGVCKGTGKKQSTNINTM